jgi:hypothetical protein
LAPGLVIDKVYAGSWFWGRPSPWQRWTDLQDLFARTREDFDPTVPEVPAAWEAAVSLGSVGQRLTLVWGQAALETSWFCGPFGRHLGGVQSLLLILVTGEAKGSL